MKISRKTWNNYITLLRKINDKAAEELERWIEIYGTDNGIADLSQIRDGDGNNLIDAAYLTAIKYGNASAAVSAQMYDSLAELSGVNVEPAEMAPNPEYGEVAKTVQGVLKTSQNVREVSGAVSRLVKRTGADTTLRNAARDGAQFAWIPSGDTCPFCLMLASNGWQYMSKKALKNGHAEHIHSNCDCTYAIRFDRNTQVAGYDPDVYREMYYSAEGNTPNERLNSMRRAQYAQNKDVINAQKRMAYAERVHMDYRHERDAKTAIVTNTKEGKIAARQIVGSPNGLYVSDALEIKPKKLQEIENNVSEAKKIIGVEGKEPPRIIIVSDTELGNTGGRFDAKSNTVYYKVLVDKDLQRHVSLHELYHWDDAQAYIAAGNTITRNQDVIDYMSKKGKAKLDKIGINADNVASISDYAEQMYHKGRYDEVYTEYRTIKGLK